VFLGGGGGGPVLMEDYILRDRPLPLPRDFHQQHVQRMNLQVRNSS